MKLKTQSAKFIIRDSAFIILLLFGASCLLAPGFCFAQALQKETTAPAGNPPPGFQFYYTKSGSSFCTKNSSGVEFCTGTGTPSGSAGGDLTGSYPNPTVAKVNGNTPGGTCTNQVVTALSTSAAPTCTTVTSAYVDNSIALTGTDINTSNQITATHLASALPINQGGTGTETGAAQNSVFAGPASGGSGAPSFQTAPTIAVTNMTGTGGFSTTGNAATATAVNFSGVASSTNTTAAMVVGSGASLAPTGTGTITATRLNGVIADIQAFGAKCDGSTDDATAIQAALNSGAGTVRVPASTSGCVFGTGLTVPSGVILEGVSDNLPGLVAKAGVSFTYGLRGAHIDGTEEDWSIKELSINANGLAGTTFSEAVISYQSVFAQSIIDHVTIFQYAGAPAVLIGPGTAGDGAGPASVTNSFFFTAADQPGIVVTDTYGAYTALIYGVYLNNDWIAVGIGNTSTQPSVEFLTASLGHIKYADIRNLNLSGSTTSGCVIVQSVEWSVFSNIMCATPSATVIALANDQSYHQSYSNIFQDITHNGASVPTNIITDPGNSWNSGNLGVSYYAQSDGYETVNFPQIKGNAATATAPASPPWSIANGGTNGTTQAAAFANIGIPLDLGAITWNNAGNCTFAAASAPIAGGTVTTVSGQSCTLIPTGLVKWGSYTLKVINAASTAATFTLGTSGASCSAWKVLVSGAGYSGTTITLLGASAYQILAFTFDGTNCIANFQ